ncbi:hypothetical protein H2201_001892 [Coniosporium apollinis]|uniref:J domain-containing protein n=2 Tax=Coniosporium TaxID=2810619 RepID=A0ABQ9P0E8_9PEZI|nr:hypothetical protein H2199_000526 [Cladosporium sp. JES 115]KAJ9668086.1 hypothetical protein H2201_001892 [Coniosporium apollinis]
MVPLPRIRDFEAILEYFLHGHQQVQAQAPQTQASQARVQQHGIPVLHRPASNLNSINTGQPAPSNHAQQLRTAVENRPAASLANLTASSTVQQIRSILASAAGASGPSAGMNTPPVAKPWIPANNQPREQTRPNPVPGTPGAVANPAIVLQTTIKQESGHGQGKAAANKAGQPAAVIAVAPSFPRPGQGFRIERNFPLSGKALTDHFLTIRKDPYAVLGIHRHATAEEIKAAYRKACLQHHPDKNQEDREGALERFHVVTQAYGVLKEQENREEYDRKVRIGKKLEALK